MSAVLAIILAALAYSLAQSIYWAWRVYTRQVFVFPPLPAIEDSIPESWPPSRVVSVHQGDDIPW